MGQQYDNDEQIVQYTLLDKEPVELGNIDIHRKDFAYHPVVLRSKTHDDTGYFGHELQTRTRPEEEAIVTVAQLPISQQWNDVGDDQQVSYRWWSWVSHLLYHGESYSSNDERPFAGGSHGDVWRARRRCPSIIQDNKTNSTCDDGKDLIVKRLKIEHGYPVLEAGLREIYFGELLAREVESSTFFTTYVDHFFREGPQSQMELWIVFENAGPSLRSFLYTPVETDSGYMFQHSAFWRRLRRGIAGGKLCKGCDEDEALVVATPALNPDHPDHGRHGGNAKDSEKDAPEGRTLLREVLRQLITAAALLHERNIVHRDIKPSNIMCTTTPPTKDGIIPRKIESVRCLLGDFSSAWDDFSHRNLYTNGPSSKEQTDEYAP
jgi:hypothetical protein